jgi:hypothetical protein
MHDGPTVGNFGWDTTTHKILRVWYYWPIMLKYSHTYSINCEVFQKSVGREKKCAFPLPPISVDNQFQ